MSHPNVPEQLMLPFREEEFPSLLPIKKASQVIGVQYRQILDAVNSGAVPHYRLGKSRKLVSVPEVISIMKTQSKF